MSVLIAPASSGARVLSNALDYPVWKVSVTLQHGTGGQTIFDVVDFWVVGAGDNLPTATGTYGTDVNYATLFKIIKSGMQGYAWPPVGSDTYAFHGMTVTQYTEATTDVSP